MLPIAFAILGFHFGLMVVLFCLADRYDNEGLAIRSTDMPGPAESDNRFSRVLVPVMVGCAALGIAGIWVPLLGSAEAFVVMAMVRIAAVAFYATR